MKIKCPYKCYEEFKEFDKDMTEIELANHFNSEHNQLSTGFSYAKLIFKIHEKIEYLISLNPKEQTGTLKASIEELKSLLEDDSDISWNDKIYHNVERISK